MSRTSHLNSMCLFGKCSIHLKITEMQKISAPIIYNHNAIFASFCVFENYSVCEVKNVASWCLFCSPLEVFFFLDYIKIIKKVSVFKKI